MGVQVKKLDSLLSIGEFLMMGGLSIIAYISILLSGVSHSSFDFVWLMATLAVFVNWPHFLVSYQMLYGSHAKKILSKPKFFFAGVVVPVALGVCLVLGATHNLPGMYVFLLLLMFFTVGWHYVKQSYGCFLIHARSRGFKMSQNEQIILRGALYTLWIASFLKVFESGQQSNWWGLEYQLPQLDTWITSASYSVVIASAAIVVLMFLRRYLVNGDAPSAVSLTPLVAIYIWLFPPFGNHVYLYMIPFFHSLQYLLFSGNYTKNKVLAEGGGVAGLLRWWGAAFILGALMFNLLPEALDGAELYKGDISPLMFVVAFNLFINIHHYFIDNVMWRGDNDEVRQYVDVGRRAPRGSQISGINAAGNL